MMLLRLLLNSNLVKKIIIILLAIFIAAITTSFGFGVKKAEGADEPTAITFKVKFGENQLTDTDGLRIMTFDPTAVFTGNMVVKNSKGDVLYTLKDGQKMKADGTIINAAGTPIRKIKIKYGVILSGNFRVLNAKAETVYTVNTSGKTTAKKTGAKAASEKSGPGCTVKHSEVEKTAKEALKIAKLNKADLDQLKPKVAKLEKSLGELDSKQKKLTLKAYDLSQRLFVVNIAMQTQMGLITDKQAAIRLKQVEAARRHTQKFVGELAVRAKDLTGKVAKEGKAISALKKEMNTSNLTKERLAIIGTEKAKSGLIGQHIKQQAALAQEIQEIEIMARQRMGLMPMLNMVQRVLKQRVGEDAGEEDKKKDGKKGDAKTSGAKNTKDADFDAVYLLLRSGGILELLNKQGKNKRRSLRARASGQSGQAQNGVRLHRASRRVRANGLPALLDVE